MKSKLHKLKVSSKKGKKKITRDHSGPRCVHCKIRKASQQRNLCNVCCRIPEIRQQYQFRNVDTWDGGGGDYSSKAYRALSNLEALTTEVILPLTPTDTIPGTRAKIMVMISRAEQGLSLTHPKDMGCFYCDEERTAHSTIHCRLPDWIDRDTIL